MTETCHFNPPIFPMVQTKKFGGYVKIVTNGNALLQKELLGGNRVLCVKTDDNIFNTKTLTRSPKRSNKGLKEYEIIGYK